MSCAALEGAVRTNYGSSIQSAGLSSGATLTWLLSPSNLSESDGTIHARPPKRGVDGTEGKQRQQPPPFFALVSKRYRCRDCTVKVLPHCRQSANLFQGKEAQTQLQAHQLWKAA